MASHRPAGGEQRAAPRIARSGSRHHRIPAGFRLIGVADDERGVGPGDLASVPTREQWHQVTMKEWAARIGVRFDINSSPAGGTLVEVMVQLPEAN